MTNLIVMWNTNNSVLLSVLTIGFIIVIVVGVICVIFGLVRKGGASPGLLRRRVVPSEGFQLHEGRSLVRCHRVVVVRVSDSVTKKV